jgi:hypothetical protein
MAEKPDGPENGMLEEAGAEPEAQCSGSSARSILWGIESRVKAKTNAMAAMECAKAAMYGRVAGGSILQLLA